MSSFISVFLFYFVYVVVTSSVLCPLIYIIVAGQYVQLYGLTADKNGMETHKKT